jgi:hypothetical protein
VGYSSTGGLSITYPLADVSDMAVGDHLWVAYVGSVFPAITGTVLDAVFDCGLVDA